MSSVAAVAPGPDISIAPRLIIPTVVVTVVVLTLYGLRMYTRIRPVWNLWWDDLTLSLGLLCGLIGCGIILSCVPYGLGRRNFYISVDRRMKGQRLFFFAQPVWGWAVALIKISMAFMFLRLKRSTGWFCFLYFMIGLHIVGAIGCNCSQFLTCRPISALWDPNLEDPVCWNSTNLQIAVYINAITNTITDLTFSFLPIVFIRKLHRPFWEKFLICCLMGLGVLASVASIVKTTLIPRYGESPVNLYNAVDLSLWCILEGQLGIIAACVPCLKSPCERFLRRRGIISFPVNNVAGGMSFGLSNGAGNVGASGDGEANVEASMSEASASKASDFASGGSGIEFYQMGDGRIRRATDVEVVVDLLKDDEGERRSHGA